MFSEKIVFLIRSLNHGGAERQLITLAKGLWAQGLQVSVAVFYSGGRLEYDLKEAGVPIIALEKKGRWDIFSFVWRLREQLKTSQAAVLHSYLVDSNIIGVVLKPLLPGLKVVWGVRASIVDLSQYDRLSRFNFWLSCRLARFADLIIVNSYSGKRHHVALGYPNERTVVIPNGIDTSRFIPDKKARKKVRTEWDVDDNVRLIGIVGRFDPLKDHPTFLRAASIVAKNDDNVRFVCVGDGSEKYKAELKTMSGELGLERLVTWVDSRDDMESVYNAMDVIVSSSHNEGFPNVIGEAMACGVPCVATDVGDAAMIVGELGRIVPARRADLLAEGIQGMLAALEHCPQEMIRDRIVEKFSDKRLIDEMKTVLQGLRERSFSRG